jgi:hypothetical protein
MARAAQAVVNNGEAHQAPRENYLNAGIRQVNKTGAGPVITVFLLLLLLFHAAWYFYIGGSYPHNQQNQHLGEAWKFAIMHEMGNSQCIDN